MGLAECLLSPSQWQAADTYIRFSIKKEAPLLLSIEKASIALCCCSQSCVSGYESTKFAHAQPQTKDLLLLGTVMHSQLGFADTGAVVYLHKLNPRQHAMASMGQLQPFQLQADCNSQATHC